MKSFLYATPTFACGDDTHTQYLYHYSRNEYIVSCQCSILLYEFNGVIPRLLSLIDSTPSRYLRCDHRRSFPIILAFSQSIPALHVVLYFASPPSLSFILLLARSMSPAATSRCVRRTLSLCSFSRDSHFRPVSPL